MTRILPEILEAAPQLIKWRRHFHQNPEPSLKEYETAATIQSTLTELDIPFEKVGETGTLGTITGTKSESKEMQRQRKILLRADIDALELPDLKGATYSSQKEGLNHACGHDAHTTALLGAADYLNKHRDSFGGTVLLVFQQAEKIGAGARQFVDSGLVDGIGEVFGLHVDPNIPFGKVEAIAGPQNASCDIFTIEVSGLNAHVAQPHRGVDALVAGANIVTEIQHIVSRQVDPLDPVVIGIGRFEAGTRYNIVADRAYIQGTVRAMTHETRDRMIAKVEEVARLTGQIHGASVTFDNYSAALPVINNEIQAKRGAKVAAEFLGGSEQVITSKLPSMGADDFAAFLTLAPDLYGRVGVNSSFETSYGLHHNQFDLDERALPIMVNYHVAYALDYLNS